MAPKNHGRQYPDMTHGARQQLEPTRRSCPGFSATNLHPRLLTTTVHILSLGMGTERGENEECDVLTLIGALFAFLGRGLGLFRWCVHVLSCVLGLAFRHQVGVLSCVDRLLW